MTKATTKCGFDDCPRPATGRGEYAWACWGHTPEADDRYPVLVTYTNEHVVWVAAASQEAATRQIQSEPYEYTKDDETVVNSGWQVAGPRTWDWDTIYQGDFFGVYQGLDCSAHVETYRDHLRALERAAKTAACAAQGHPGAEVRRTDVWCPVCWSLPLTTLAVSDVL